MASIPRPSNAFARNFDRSLPVNDVRRDDVDLRQRLSTIDIERMSANSTPRPLMTTSLPTYQAPRPPAPRQSPQRARRGGSRGGLDHNVQGDLATQFMRRAQASQSAATGQVRRELEIQPLVGLRRADSHKTATNPDAFTKEMEEVFAFLDAEGPNLHSLADTIDLTTMNGPTESLLRGQSGQRGNPGQMSSTSRTLGSPRFLLEDSMMRAPAAGPSGPKPRLWPGDNLNVPPPMQLSLCGPAVTSGMGNGRPQVSPILRAPKGISPGILPVVTSGRPGAGLGPRPGPRCQLPTSREDQQPLGKRSRESSQGAGPGPQAKVSADGRPPRWTTPSASEAPTLNNIPIEVLTLSEDTLTASGSGGAHQQNVKDTASQPAPTRRPIQGRTMRTGRVGAELSGPRRRAPAAAAAAARIVPVVAVPRSLLKRPTPERASLERAKSERSMPERSMPERSTRAKVSSVITTPAQAPPTNHFPVVTSPATFPKPTPSSPVVTTPAIAMPVRPAAIGHTPAQLDAVATARERRLGAAMLINTPPASYSHLYQTALTDEIANVQAQLVSPFPATNPRPTHSRPRPPQEAPPLNARLEKRLLQGSLDHLRTRLASASSYSPYKYINTPPPSSTISTITEKNPDPQKWTSSTPTAVLMSESTANPLSTIHGHYMCIRTLSHTDPKANTVDKTIAEHILALRTLLTRTPACGNAYRALSLPERDLLSDNSPLPLPLLFPQSHSLPPPPSSTSPLSLPLNTSTLPTALFVLHQELLLDRSNDAHPRLSLRRIAAWKVQELFCALDQGAGEVGVTDRLRMAPAVLERAVKRLAKLEGGKGRMRVRMGVGAGVGMGGGLEVAAGVNREGDGKGAGKSMEGAGEPRKRDGKGKRID